MGLKERQLTAVQAAEGFWDLDIIDPKPGAKDPWSIRSQKFIDSIIRTKAGLNWSWEREYTGDGDFAWCGAFVSACYAKAGLQLKYREKNFASTYRLDRWPQGISPEADVRQVTMDDSKVRKYCRCESVDDILEFGIQAGDIGLVGESGYGTHIVLITNEILRDHPPFISTIEGNGFGTGLDNKKRNGVIKKTRPLEALRRIIRPALADFE